MAWPISIAPSPAIDEPGVGFYLPEIYRLRGECLLALDRANKDEAKRAFAAARDIAQPQGAVIFERRAETSLAELDSDGLVRGGDGGSCRRGSFHGGDVALHRLLHLFEGAHFDLTDALARHAELVGELFQRDRLIGEPPRFEDAPFAIVEHA